MTGATELALELLVANVAQGAVALAWAMGLRRFAGPISINLWTDLLGLALVLPVMLGLARLLGLPGPPPGWRLVRADLWVDEISSWGWPFTALLLLLVAGTTALFVVQEALPAWRWRQGRLVAERRRDARLDAALERVLAGFAKAGQRLPQAHRPRVRRLETDGLVAALQGLVEPTVLVSRGLLEKLDDDELHAVLAHELAHLARGGNARLLLVWALRAVQAPSPAALILARGLFEAQEAACDAIAARATARPGALAGALLKVQGTRRPVHGDAAGPLHRARAEVVWRSDLAATRHRVRALLDQSPSGLAWRPGIVAAALVLCALLWAIR